MKHKIEYVEKQPKATIKICEGFIHSPGVSNAVFERELLKCSSSDFVVRSILSLSVKAQMDNTELSKTYDCTKLFYSLGEFHKDEIGMSRFEVNIYVNNQRGN